jgi:hypothetical protein
MHILLFNTFLIDFVTFWADYSLWNQNDTSKPPCEITRMNQVVIILLQYVGLLTRRQELKRSQKNWIDFDLQPSLASESHAVVVSAHLPDKTFLDPGSNLRFEN